MNLYSLINEELVRMYAERDNWFRLMLEVPDIKDSYGHKTAHPNAKIFADKYKEMDAEIVKLREKIFGQFERYDEKIQEKVAELALTGQGDG